MSTTPVEVIQKTKSGSELQDKELDFLMEGYLDGSIPDYQMSAWLMAVFFRGLSPRETATLTRLMLHSGKVLDLSRWSAKKVDKHSTGGVGDKTSLLIAPIVASAGLLVPMISGRGLGHTGGTLDKLESIPGFNTRLNLDDFFTALENTGVGLIGQTEDICPADKRLYALRDVTGTVDSIPLICASIMSKKLAEGIDGLALDVKFGSGAFMKTPEQAERLAQALVDTASYHGKKATALLTSMDQPLGRMIGNSLEVEECVALMKGEDLPDLSLQDLEDTRELSLQLSAEMLWLGEAVDSVKEGYDQAKKILDSGKAFEKWQEICHQQGGNLDRLPKADHQKVIFATEDGYLHSYDSEKIGRAGIILGAGRLRQEDTIDPVAGIQLHKKIGETVTRGEKLFTLYGSKTDDFAEAEGRLLDATEISLPKPAVPTLIEKRIFSKI